MANQRSSVPLSVSILTLMALIVVPLSFTLSWLGWRGVNQMETEDVDQRMGALDDAVRGFLGNGMRLIVSVGQVLAEQDVFAPKVGGDVDTERLRQLRVVLDRHPAVDAAFAGYPDGHFVYAGRTESLLAGPAGGIPHPARRSDRAAGHLPARAPRAVKSGASSPATGMSARPTSGPPTSIRATGPGTPVRCRPASRRSPPPIASPGRTSPACRSGCRSRRAVCWASMPRSARCRGCWCSTRCRPTRSSSSPPRAPTSSSRPGRATSIPTPPACRATASCAPP